MKKSVLLFPGQGSQYVGMGKTLYQDYSAARDVFKEAEEILGYDMAQLCFKGSLSNLSKLDTMLPAIMTVSIAAFRVYLTETEIKPDFLAGHSLGEYTALVCAGVLSFADALKLVEKRGRLALEHREKTNGEMTLISNIGETVLEEICKKISTDNEQAYISCYNAPNQFMISGHKEAVFKAEEEASMADAQITPMLVSPPFHCSLLQPAVEKMQEFIDALELKDIKIPVISNATAKPYKSANDVKHNLALQIMKPVQWSKTMQYLYDQGVDLAIEIGPQAILTNLVKENVDEIKAVSFGQKDDRDKLLQSLKTKPDIIYQADSTTAQFVPTVITKCLVAAVCTKNENWDNDEYDRGVIKPYERIEEIQDSIEQSGGIPTYEQMKEALELLRTILKTKKVPVEEQCRRFKQIFIEMDMEDLFKDFKLPNESEY